MATLTETAYHARRAINWAILAVIAYVILRAFWSIFVVVWLTVFPPKAPPPNHAFGKLPAIKFAEPQATPSGQLTFTLETIQGRVPPASPSATVYFMPKSPANLLALTKTQDFAKRLSLNPTPIAETKNIYRFEDPDLLLRRLRYDIVSNNFILRYGFEQDPGVFSERNIPGSAGALAEAKNMLQVYELFVPELAGGRSTVTYLRISGNKFTPTTSQSQADAARVDFFRRPVGGIPVFTPYPDEGLVSFVFSGANNTKKRVLQFAYTFWPIDYETSATYGLKSSEQAWEELKSGKGYIARYPKTGNVITVRNARLGYYDSFEPQTYLQPMFVFEGDDGFLGYVPAVAPPWTE
ncbi:MAG: hypothetical protein UY16_C0016G0011 [Candidatus Gottesmanbacteria bacterium GW2011_GWA2_47_9]|uniref:Uncharacterized protein n=1 Tax=Candidatus Gottesmanbacteria bacterium GW2011_GWA2_47_9 TaxID=1618445 RepID=A0A0G1U1I0_9BACT|nr:MAG: hypothetical protein UY16_C0016G0011 [Candidatus Gottesmanbacteria bacterium GW2011_GWA2_47_9]